MQNTNQNVGDSPELRKCKHAVYWVLGVFYGDSVFPDLHNGFRGQRSMSPRSQFLFAVSRVSSVRAKIYMPFVADTSFGSLIDGARLLRMGGEE